MLLDLFSPQRLHTRIVSVYLVLLILGEGLTWFLIERSIERHARATVAASLDVAAGLMQRQLAPLSRELAMAHGPSDASALLPALLATRELTGADVALLVRTEGQAWQLLASTVPAAQGPALLQRWLASHEDRDELWQQAGHSLMARTLALPAAPPQAAVRALLLRPMDEVRAGYAHFRLHLLVLSLLGVVVFGLVGLLASRRLTQPLQRLNRSVRRIERGEYDGEVHSGYHGEIAELAQSFESMRQTLQAREGEIQRLSRHDNLTDLPNRAQFRADLRQALDRALRRNQTLAVLLLDLDRFKHVNDQLGHRFGDRLLRGVAGRLRVHTEGQARMVLARMGGDEFALLLPGADAVQATLLAQRIQSDFERPLTIDDQTVDLGAGIGMAIGPEHGRDADTLLGHAEAAMYAAKDQRQGPVLYRPELDARDTVSLTLLGELRQAVDQGQLRLFVQPKARLSDGVVVGAEALVRWAHPVRGVVPPRGFVPFAEQTGFVRLLTGWMLEEGARQAQSLARRGLAVKLSLNLSTRDLLDPALPERLATLMAAHDLAPGALVLEITESAIMDDPQRALHTLHHLHGMGLRLSIDDFGTGYSSLAYLKSLPVQELKIDRSFVKAMETDPQDAKIVSSTVELAHGLGLTVVAEGVESERTWHLLRELGCDEAQGHLIAKPMPVAQFEAWLARWVPPARPAAAGALAPPAAQHD